MQDGLAPRGEHVSRSRRPSWLRPAVDGATGGRHRGFDAAGAVLAWASIASLDLPLPESVEFLPLLLGMVAALACFTLAGHRGKAVVHRSRMTTRFWVVLAASAFGAVLLTGATYWVANAVELPVRNTIVGAVLVVSMAVTSRAANRAAFRRPGA
ncbi:hypothetical protein AB0I28_30505 [Phytomonospora sp. NPDC050363]|uniref:hypothetical protein n=1 Tax=Phytomonospora sp. NPDC050363 TaxID=3155642 RepID=UPI0033FCCF7F